MTDESVVVDNGQTYVSEETAIVATEAAAQAKQWAEESETQANSATNSANIAYQARNEAVNAVNGFTQRVTEATNTFNSNATAKTNAFNSNATSKTNDFNTNATNKTTAFNNNASSKTTDFNNNATAKTTAFNNNYTEKKALIDAQVAIAESSATNANNYKNKAREWAISQNVVDNEDYSSKYWARKSKEWAESVSSPVNKNLSNLNPQGQNIANWSTNVANCITEIAQDIKLELNNGTLTLKAGSKVYVPNGFESGGTTPKFDVISISSDIAFPAYSYTGESLVFIKGTSGQPASLGSQSSGASNPGTGVLFWYDTQNNLCKFSSGQSGTFDSGGWSFPVALVNRSSGSWVSIDQVFNGFGYIGSTVFALPGVKGLMPNGRNEDGTLKNLEFTTRGVLTLTGSGNFKGVGIYINATYLQYYGRPYFVANELSDIPSNFGGVGYIISENMLYTFSNGKIQNKQTYCVAGVYDWTNSAITSLTPKTPFHALDRNDSSTISGWSMPSSSYIDLNLGASGATYTAPTNGYFCLDKAGTQNEYIDIRNNTTGLLRSKTTISASGTESIAVYMPCKKGDEIAVVYTATGTTNIFRFIYAEGENV
jgi:hypothetical protein